MNDAPRVSLVPIQTLHAARGAWQALHDGALEPNPFYTPDFVLAGAEHLEKPGTVFALMAHRGTTLAGLLPLHRPGLRSSLPGGIWSAYANPFTCLTTPLLAPEHPEQTLEAMLAHLDGTTPASAALVFPILALHRPVGRMLEQLNTRGARRTRVLSHYPRAWLAPSSGMAFGDYVAQESADVRKSFRRREARLLGFGPVAHSVFAASGAARAKALEQFLALEASGWKGRHGTALACRADTLAFIEAAFRQEGTLAYEVERLSVDDIPVAMSLNLVGGGIVHTFKQAYDETWRLYAPGKLLDRNAILRVIERSGATAYDGCGLAGYPVDEIWHERLVVGQKWVALGTPPDAARFEAVLRRGQRRAAWFKRLRSLHDILRGNAAPRRPTTT